MSNKLICIISLLLFIILVLLITNKKHYENFESKSKSKSNAWTTNKDVLASEKRPLNVVQQQEVKNMITAITNSQLKTLIASQSPLLTGPQGIQGPQGPAGTKLIASGRLINKNGTFDSEKSDNNYFSPKYVVTRTEGTSDTSSLAFMDVVSPFASYQNWQIDIDNNLKNRYDNSCLTLDQKNPINNLYMSKCTDDPNQKWSWDKSNRIISTSASDSTHLKCIGLTNYEQNIITTNIPNCIGKECSSNAPRRYLTVKDCDVNNITEDELWTFI